MAKKVEILFTGLNKAKFKTGNSMMREVRKHVKEFGKENVSSSWWQTKSKYNR